MEISNKEVSRLTPTYIQLDCTNVKIDNNLTDLTLKGERQESERATGKYLPLAPSPQPLAPKKNYA
jgi:hypothetical protein